MDESGHEEVVKHAKHPEAVAGERNDLLADQFQHQPGTRTSAEADATLSRRVVVPLDG